MAQKKPKNQSNPSKWYVQIGALIALVVVVYIDVTTQEPVNSGVYGTLFASIIGVEVYNMIK